MSTISFSLSDWRTICQHFKLDANAVLALLMDSSPMGRPNHNLLTDKEKNDLIKWGGKRLFNKIALFLGRKIFEICPFYTRAGYNDILIGSPDSGVSNPGYLGWNVFDCLSKSPLSVKERRQLIKNPSIQKKLKQIYHLSQQYLIKPMMNIMFEKGHEMFQAEMNRYLNLDKLDEGTGRQGDRVTAELFARLRAQKIMEKYKPGHNVFHIKKKPRMDYAPSVFTMPTTLGFSKGHETTLRILEGLVKDTKQHSAFWRDL